MTAPRTPCAPFCRSPDRCACHALQAEGTNGFKDPNILANHLHGFMGNPGTDNVPCDPAPADGVACYRGDNIFADVFPGQCTEWQYDVPNEHPLGMLW